MKPELEQNEAVKFFSEAGRGKTVLHVVNLARFNPGIILLMGDEGSGRSFLLTRLSERVNKKPGLLGIVNQVVKTKSDLYQAIANGFDVETIEGEGVDSLEEKVVDFLQGSFVTHRPVILAVDDVQQFSLPMLEELIKLVRRYKKISLVLTGDNNLAAMLKHLDTTKAARHEITLQPLNRGEMRQFINWRLPFAIPDAEFEDVVNTTNGNLGLLEREAHKKELAQASRQTSNKSNVLQALLDNRKPVLAVAGVLAIVVAAVVFYPYVLNKITAKPAPVVEKPVVETVVAEVKQEAPTAPEAAAEEKNEMLDRQLELLTTPAVSEPVAVQKPVVVQEPIVVQEAVVVKKTIEQKVIVPAPVIKEAPIKTLPAEVISAKEVVNEKETPVIKQAVVELPETKTVSNDDAEKLLATPSTHYSIQILAAQSKKTVDRFMAEHANNHSLSYFRSTREGKDWYIVLYGDYENRKSALAAADALPEDFKKTAPWPRRLSEIHKLISERQ